MLTANDMDLGCSNEALDSKAFEARLPLAICSQSELCFLND